MDKEKNCYCNGKCTLAHEPFTLLAAGKNNEATVATRHALINNPRCARLHGTYGLCLNRNNKPEYAIEHFNKVISIEGERSTVCCNLGHTWLNIGDLLKAAIWYEKAIKLDINNAQAFVGMAKVNEIKGNFDMALALLNRAEKINPNENGMRIVKAESLVGRGFKAKALLAFDPTKTVNGAEQLERGRIFEKGCQFDAAWQCYDIGNKLLAAHGFSYGEATAKEKIHSLQSFAAETTLEALRQPSNELPHFRPIFICGYPRSGTTLMEQCLSNHPMIQAGDELPFINEIADKAQGIIGSSRRYPFCLSDLMLADKKPFINVMRQLYVERCLARGLSTNMLVTDKMPMNEMHLPLIRILFPNALIIYMRRHPLDVIVSNYATFLTHGFNQSFNLETCAKHYVALDGLYSHYKRKMHLGSAGSFSFVGKNFYDINYEHLVSEHRTTRGILKGICNMLNLPYKESMEHPNDNARYARTASYAQVKKPINDKSIWRWKNFRKHLEPVIPIVRNICDREGYEI